MTLPRWDGRYRRAPNSVLPTPLLDQSVWHRLCAFMEAPKLATVQYHMYQLRPAVCVVCVCVCVCVRARARARPTEGYGAPLTPEHMNLRSVLHYSSGSEPHHTDAPPSVRDTSHAALTELLAN